MQFIGATSTTVYLASQGVFLPEVVNDELVLHAEVFMKRDCPVWTVLRPLLNEKSWRSASSL
jgi:hypothetical protein